ncbi:MAG: GNAT family N-acetyltransferase [Candidatus Bathyarchaeia archaeon]
MKIVIKGITRENLNDIPRPCRGCLYWEFPEDFEKLHQHKKTELAEEKKKEWFMKTLREFGNCGKIVYQDKTPIGYAQYAPSSRLPQASNYKFGPPGRIEDGTVFLSCLYISEERQRGKGMGTKLLNSIITDLRDRGFKVVETFALRGSPNNPSGPIEPYLKRGFQIEDETNPDFPLVRLEL